MWNVGNASFSTYQTFILSSVCIVWDLHFDVEDFPDRVYVNNTEYIMFLSQKIKQFVCKSPENLHVLNKTNWWFGIILIFLKYLFLQPILFQYLHTFLVHAYKSFTTSYLWSTILQLNVKHNRGATNKKTSVGRCTQN